MQPQLQPIEIEAVIMNDHDFSIQHALRRQTRKQRRGLDGAFSIASNCSPTTLIWGNPVVLRIPGSLASLASPYLVVYSVASGDVASDPPQVVILRVLHGAMHWPRPGNDRKA